MFCYINQNTIVRRVMMYWSKSNYHAKALVFTQEVVLYKWKQNLWDYFHFNGMFIQWQGQMSPFSDTLGGQYWGALWWWVVFSSKYELGVHNVKKPFIWCYTRFNFHPQFWLQFACIMLYQRYWSIKIYILTSTYFFNFQHIW